MHLPPSAIEDMMDRLGGPTKVAEMTGRSIRQVRVGNKFEMEARVTCMIDEDENAVTEKKWWADGANIHTDSLNVKERGAFLRGEKLVAIISAAASTGISLHADRNVPNQRRRFHCTVELPWAADQAIQQLGRSHRTNQSSAPVFCLISSGLGGENRFISSVARRLQSLGAITQGDRRASLGAMSLGEFMFESKFGSRAVSLLRQLTSVERLEIRGMDWKAVIEESKHLIDLDQDHTDDFCSIPENDLDDSKLFEMLRAAIKELEIDSNQGKASRMVSKFLNRILGLPFAHQTLIFNSFSSILESLILEAKREGKYDQGLMSLGGKVNRREEKKVIYTDRLGRPVTLDSFSVYKGLDFAHVVRELKFQLNLVTEPVPVPRTSIEALPIPEDSLIQNWINEAMDHNISFFINKGYPKCPLLYSIILARKYGNNLKNWTVFRPYNSLGIMYSDENLYSSYRKIIELPKIKQIWNIVVQSKDAIEMMEQRYNLISGTLIPVLGLIQKQEQKKSVSTTQLKTYLVVTEQGERVLGVKVDNLTTVRNALSVKQQSDSSYEIKYPGVPVNATSFDYGFEINSKYDVVSVNARGIPLDIKIGYRVLQINDSRVNKQHYVSNLNDAIRYYSNVKLDDNGKVPTQMSVTIRICNPSKKDLIPEYLEPPAPISYLIMKELVVDPKRERKKIEKIEKKASKLFDSDSDDDIKIHYTPSLKRSHSDGSTFSSSKKKSLTKAVKIQEEEEEEVIEESRRVDISTKFNQLSSTTPAATRTRVAPVSTAPKKQVVIVKDETDDEILDFDFRNKTF